MQPKAYSYIRFSTTDQIKGDSKRRQLEMSERFAADNGLSLVTDYQDLGLSAYRGKNATEGALAQFIEAVKSGKVAKGSYLLVESLDRLSRDSISKALEQFLFILRSGVNIATLSDNRIYTSDSADNFTELLISLSVMSRAHEESKIKGQRVGKAWANKRELARTEGKAYTSICPKWMKLKEGEYSLTPDRAEIVKRIFTMSISGVGAASIARKFNEESIPVFGRGRHWHESYIKKILNSRTVIGELQPHRMDFSEDGSKTRIPDGAPIADFYPAVIDEATFHKAKANRAAPLSKGRKGKGFTNLFTGMVKCSSCGSNLHFLNKGYGPKGGMYLQCSASKAKAGCTEKAFRYQPFEQAMLGVMAGCDHSKLIPDGDVIQNEKSSLGEEIAGLETEKVSLFEANEKLVDAISSGQAPKSIVSRLENNELRISEITEGLEQLSNELLILESKTTDVEQNINSAVEVIEKLYLLQAEGNQKESSLLREQLHKLYRGLVESLTATQNGFDVVFSSGETVKVLFKRERISLTTIKDGKPKAGWKYVIKSFIQNSDGSETDIHVLLDEQINRRVILGCN